jgi:hypothetical protein
MHGSVNTMPGAAGFGCGHGGGFGSFGKGRGWRNCYSLTGLPGFRKAGCGYPYASFTAQEEAGFLRSQAELLRRQLEDIQDRIGILEKSGEREG